MKILLISFCLIVASLALACSSNSVPPGATHAARQSVATPESQTVCRSSEVVLSVEVGADAYQWYKNGTSAPFKLVEIASIQKGTKTESLTLVSVQTTASYYCKVTTARLIETRGPYRVVVDYSCIAPGA